VRGASGIGGLATEATRRAAAAKPGGPKSPTTCARATGGSSTSFVIAAEAACDSSSWMQRVEALDRLNAQHGISGSSDRPAVDVSASGLACECLPWTWWAGASGLTAEWAEPWCPCVAGAAAAAGWAQNTPHSSRAVGDIPTITTSMSGTSRRTIQFTITPFAPFRP